MAADQAEFVRRLAEGYTVALADGFAEAVQAAGREASRTMRDLARIITEGAAPQEMARAHRTIAELAQDSVVRSYDQTVTGRRKAGMRGYDYRRSANQPRNIRYAGGKLRAALKSPELWSADQHGIRFVNVDFLDRTARHWARLNAGAGSRGTGSRRRFEVQWGKLTVAAIGIDMTPSPSFMVPRGYWRAPGGGVVSPGAPGTSAFFPIGEGPFPTGRPTGRGDRERFGTGKGVKLQRRRLSRGIEARNFLDAGAARIAEELGPTYERVHRQLYTTGIARVRPARSTIRVHARRVNLTA